MAYANGVKGTTYFAGAAGSCRETGLGGVADATNVFAPANLACAIITAIDKDHLKALGRPIRVINLLHVRSSRFSTFVHSLRLLIS